MTRNLPRPNLSAVALAMRPPTAFLLMLPRQPSKSLRMISRYSSGSTRILTGFYFLVFAISYMRIGELGMSSWRAKHGRDVVTYFRMAMIPCAPYIVPALFECCMYFLITHENENAIITIYPVALVCTMTSSYHSSDYCSLVAQVVSLLAATCSDQGRRKWWGCSPARGNARS